MRKMISKLVPFRIKYLISLVLYSVFRIRMVLRNSVPKVETNEHTVEYIINNKVSVSRFGDGEFTWIFQNGDSENFEKNSSELAMALKRVIKSNDDRLIICIPDVFSGLSQFNKKAKEHWGISLGLNGMKWISVLDKRRYFNSQITRPYIDYRDKKNSKKNFLLLKKIWENRDILIVEGVKTRFGIGNDLLSGAKSVKRILAPATNAFEKYNSIKRETLSIVMNCEEDTLVLLSLGPTANILASDLAKKGIQSIDIGHLDVEYSWYLMGADEKVPIEGKYVNEVPNGHDVKEITDEKLNRMYESEIIKIIKS